MKKYPFVSFIIPTLNAERYLDICLRSIRKQNYPSNRYEILVVDGGSSDTTFEIAKKFGCEVFNNPMVDPESGKAIGIKASKGNIIALLDADNVIVRKDWLKKMVFPIIDNSKLFGVESSYFYRQKDNVFNKYCMLIHIADPFSRALAANLKIEKKTGYQECGIPEGQSYPLGANGFLWNKRVINELGNDFPVFEESNFSYYIMQKGFRTFARVSGYGIYHYHINSFMDFVKKRLKIGNKFLNRKVEKRRTWIEGVPRSRIVFSVIYCTTFIGPLIESSCQFIKSGNLVWFLHPFMCFTSVILYSYVFIKRKLLL